jgi:oxygen-dependent protoporphyrinogen oxidase
MRIAVVGGGIAGLSAALRLSERHDVTVFEREAQPGGKIRSQSLDGFLFEWGPNGFLSTAFELQSLAKACGLENELVTAHEAAAKRYVYYAGRLHPLPSSPPAVLRMSLLTVRGKLRALRALGARPKAGASEESVHEFFARRFGDEVADRIAAPVLLGISAGNARATSLDALFPRLRELEREHGSLLRALIRSRRPPGRLTTVRGGGMARLTEALARALDSRFQRSSAVRRIARNGASWRVEHAGGELGADAVVLAAPAYTAAALLDESDPELAELLRNIPYAPMRVAGIAFRASEGRAQFDGFGFLAARGQGVRILGALYTSTMFPEQAPPGSAYLRVFLGGAEDPTAMELSSEAARSVVRADLKTTLGISAEPIAFHEHLWPHAIPQYTLGHSALLREIDARLLSLPGLALTGNAYRGISVGDSVRDAAAVADRLALLSNE